MSNDDDRRDATEGTTWIDRILGAKQSQKRAKIIGVLAGAACMLLICNALAILCSGTDYWIKLSDSVGWVATAAFILAIIAGLVGFATLNPEGFDGSWTRMDKIMSSGGFYFFAGICMLLYAIHMTQSSLHPSLTFLLAMLGVAITLFGTGSQAVGSFATAGAPLPDARAAIDGQASASADLDDVKKAVTATADEVAKTLALGDDAAKIAALPSLEAIASAAKDKTEKLKLPAANAGGASGSENNTSLDWKPVKANAAIAGGAAVLTALFGWGVIYFRTEIKDVFGFYDRYVKIRIEACASNAAKCSDVSGPGKAPVADFNLMEYSANTSLINGSPVYSIVSGNEIQLLVFADAINQNNSVQLHFTRNRENEKIGPEIDRDLRVNIPAETLKAIRTKDGAFADPKIKEKNQAECRQYYSKDVNSSSTSTTCALHFMDYSNRGDEVYVIQYGLNFFREDSARSKNSVNGLDVAFQ